MKLFPQNLRDRQHAEIIKRRSYGIQGKGTGESAGYVPDIPPPQMGKLGRLWAKNSGLNERQAATGLPAAALSTMASMYAPASFAGFIGFLITLIAFKKGEIDPATTLAVSTGITGLLGYLGAVPWARAAFRSLYSKPLNVAEIEVLLEHEQTDLERAQLLLIRDAIRQEVPAASEADLRSAIQALGEAIDQLPVVTVTPLDTTALRAEAESLLREAAEQADRVIAESLERRADAHLRRAEAHERSALYVRRTDVLRAEIEAQIAALREGLATFNAGMTPGGIDMAHLSESARRVASEAVSAAMAREELDTPSASTVYRNGTVGNAEQSVQQSIGLR